MSPEPRIRSRLRLWQANGAAAALHHDALVHAELPLWAAVGLFVLAWQVMIAAMMLPSSLP
jgi:predicted metal-binding membrane protein